MITDYTYRGYRIFAEATDPTVDIYHAGELIDSNCPTPSQAEALIDHYIDGSSR
jgi:hypothetical protein